MPCRIAYVLTVGFGASDDTPIQVALDEVLRLDPFCVIVVHDRKGRSGICARAAVESRAAHYAAAGVTLGVYPVDQDETALRWRAGAVEKGFEDPTVEAVFVFATDFDKLPTESAREAWRQMADAARPDALIVGEYQPKHGSFKDEFYKLVAKPAVDAIFPGEAPFLVDSGLRQFRTEFFVLGRAVLDRLRLDGIMWTMDPTTDMALVCLRSGNLTLQVFDLGSFEDRADTRDPLGELFQVTRYVFQLLVNLVRLRRSAGLDRADQIRAYEELIPVIDRAVEVVRYAVRRNLERLKENSKVAAFMPEAPRGERWVPARFRGFSYLLDNPGDSLGKAENGVPYVSCDVSQGAQAHLVLYRKLARAVEGLEPRLRRFSFCPLRLPSYHVTLWDGVNDSNAHSLTTTKRAEYYEYVRGLPTSVAGVASPILPPSVVSLDRRWSLKFRFKELKIWVDAAALVALLEPADEETTASIEVLERHRRDLDAQFVAIGKLPNRQWTPHVTCGYFKTSEDAAAAKQHLPTWTGLVKTELADETIQFSSASLYSFTDMEHFWRHPLPAVLVPLSTIKAAITEGVGFLGERGDQKIAITYQYPTREQLGAVRWQPLARNGNKHYCVTPYGLDIGVFDHRASQDRHYHRIATELYRVLDGDLTIFVAGEEHVLSAGQEIIIMPYAVHEVVSAKPFVAEVIVLNPDDKYISESWSVPGHFAAPALHLRPEDARLGSDGAAEIFRDGVKIALTVFSERWTGAIAATTESATRIFTVLAGSIALQVNDETYELNARDTITVFPQSVLRVHSPGSFLAELLTLNCS
jgi:quercetin dioxygenase-like cupin family protein